MGVFAVAILALVAFGAGSAGGATNLPAPQSLSRPHDVARPTAIGYTAAGTVVVSWSWVGPAVDEYRTHISMASRPLSHARFGPERPLPASVVAGPQAYGRDRVLVATQTDRVDRRTGASVASTLSVRFGDLRGRFGAPHVVARSFEPIAQARLAVNSRGAALLAWSTSRDYVHGAVVVSMRRPGEAFGRSVRLSDRAVTGLSAAVGASGDMLVAWNQFGVHARFKRRADRAFGRLERVRSKPGASPQAAVMADGSAWLGWYALNVASGGTIGIPYIQVARRPKDARHFDRALLLAHGRGAGGRQLGTSTSFAAGPHGSAAFAWSSFEYGPAEQEGVSIVRVARIDASGGVIVDELARSHATEPGADVSLTFASDGGAAVAWTQQTATSHITRQAYLSERAAGGAWSAPVLFAANALLSDVVASYAPHGGPLTLLFNAPLAGAGDGVHSITRPPAEGATRQRLRHSLDHDAAIEAKQRAS